LLVEHRSAPEIGWIARLGAAAADGYRRPKPLYLRPPDARPQDATIAPPMIEIVRSLFARGDRCCRKPA
jgi:hypothetical protein